MTREACLNLRRALAELGPAAPPWLVVSRSDSTLRGHYPVETDAIAEVLGPGVRYKEDPPLLDWRVPPLLPLDRPLAGALRRPLPHPGLLPRSSPASPTLVFQCHLIYSLMCMRLFSAHTATPPPSQSSHLHP